jgi:hypothetical protein
MENNEKKWKKDVLPHNVHTRAEKIIPHTDELNKILGVQQLNLSIFCFQ